MIQVYGSAFSRGSMVMCVLETLGVEYESFAFNPRSEGTRTDDYLSLNPTGKVPTLIDGDLVLFESQAILFYLGRKYGDNLLWVDTLEEEADLFRWSLFISNQIEVPALDMLVTVKYAPDGQQPDPDRIASLGNTLERFLPVLEQHLQGKEYLVSDKLTVADFHGAQVLSWPKLAGFDYSRYPAIEGWLRAILALPVQKQVRQKATA